MTAIFGVQFDILALQIQKKCYFSTYAAYEFPCNSYKTQLSTQKLQPTFEIPCIHTGNTIKYPELG